MSPGIYFLMRECECHGSNLDGHILMDEAFALKYPSSQPLRVARLKLHEQSRKLLKFYLS